MLDLTNIKIEYFKPCINQIFQIILEEEKIIEIELIEVTKSNFFVPEQGRPFSLIFRSHQDILIPQNIYLLKHEQIGEFSPFITTIGLDKEGMCYEVIFA
jgi:hypothetical protein